MTPPPSVRSVSLESPARPLRVAIVGSGPAGFYATEALAKAPRDVDVDIFERLPTPFGLVRGGVAPDHQNIKKVARIYARRAESDGLRFFGNVALGKDIEVDDLRAHYDAIIYAVGGERSRQVNAPGIDLPQSHPAPGFVGWYNGHPDYAGNRYDLSVKRAAVVGNGNVAIDVARILSRSPEALTRTDIADYALDALREGSIEEVFVLGRRGPLQASFTPKELGELAELSNVDIVIDPKELRLDQESLRDLQSADKHQRKNLKKLAEISRDRRRLGRRALHFRFLVSAEEVLADDGGNVRALRLRHNELRRNDQGILRPHRTDRVEELDVGMVVWAVGYRGSPIEGVPFDDDRGVVENEDGRVTDNGHRRRGEYVVGWAGTGAQGLIGSHKATSAEIVERLLEDLDRGELAMKDLPPPSAMDRLLDERDVQVVRYQDWKRLDELERKRGELRGAPRSKLTNVSEMLAHLALAKTSSPRP